MFVVGSHWLAIILCFCTLILWGSWANTLKLVDDKKWPFLLFMWDYSFGFFGIALLLAIVLGSFGSQGTSFLTNLGNAGIYAILFAVIAGVIFNLANLFFVSAVELTGLATAITIGVGTSLILGVAINYVAEPIGNPYLIFIGAAVVFIGILLSSISFTRIPAKENSGKRKSVGILVGVLAGLGLGVFFRFLGISMSPQLNGSLTPYTALVIFSLAIIASNKIWCWLFRAVKLAPPDLIPGHYFKGTKKEHSLGWLGGAMFSLGMGFILISSSKTGAAISFGIAQSCILVTMIWGVFVWKEFKHATGNIKLLLTLTFLAYIIGILCLALAQ